MSALEQRSANRRSARVRRGDTERHGERPSRVGVAVVTVFMVGVLIYFMLPVYWLVVASTKSTSDLFSTPGLWFADLNLFSNLSRLSTYDGGIFWRWMFNSFIYSGVGSVLMTFVSVVSGYALAVYRFRGRAVVLGAVLGSMLVPQTVLAQPTYQLLVEIGLNNTYAGVLIPSLVYPFGVMLGYVYARSSIPTEILEAARLDGASEWRIFLSIGSRLMGTGTVTILLFAFIGSWNNFMLPLLVLNDQSLMPVTVGLNGWSQTAITVPELQTLTVVGALVSVIPVVLVFVGLQRYWRSGLTAGGVRF
ncbi:carbohydrate ABC transporter permease [Phytoactinopolyspora endophytica]|uniref:carbohydrate ABC transporter permease n=1 Tax=Phytoactinopolyspora endophytica TaxID=1642495 RepID=UPI00101C15CD|nr:carbohydrate ABC transporter permease [Phytoactinopolyspora endophytica]